MVTLILVQNWSIYDVMGYHKYLQLLSLYCTDCKFQTRPFSSISLVSGKGLKPFLDYNFLTFTQLQANKNVGAKNTTLNNAWAHFIRIHPRGHEGKWTCLRIALYGCQTGMCVSDNTVCQAFFFVDCFISLNLFCHFFVIMAGSKGPTMFDDVLNDASISKTPLEEPFFLGKIY